MVRGIYTIKGGSGSFNSYAVGGGGNSIAVEYTCR